MKNKASSSSSSSSRSLPSSGRQALRNKERDTATGRSKVNSPKVLLALGRKWLWLGWCLPAVGHAASKQKPLFEYDDHYVMLNDFDRNLYYQDAIEAAVKECGPECSVLDVGAGSGLLSMMAAKFGAKDVLALEANPNLAALAEATIARNRGLYPNSNVTVLAALSSAVGLDQLPKQKPADILVTETFGTMLLGEGALNFVPEVRNRLLKPGGRVVPAGGCQYVTIVEIPDFAETLAAANDIGLNLTSLQQLQDTVYWKATVGASKVPFKRLSERKCILEVDLANGSREDVPLNRTFRLPAIEAGKAHAALLDWDIWLDSSRDKVLSTAPGQRNFAGDVAWGWLLQPLEAVDDFWKAGASPKLLEISRRDELELGVEYIARGISMHIRCRLASGDHKPNLPKDVRNERVLRFKRELMVQGSEFYLPLAGDQERQSVYSKLLAKAIGEAKTKRPDVTVLDVSANSGIPGLLAAKKHGVQALTLTRLEDHAKLLRQVASDNGLNDTMFEAHGADPSTFMDILMPASKKADVVVVEPPGSPLHGLSPFSLLPTIQKKLLVEGGVVVPGGACFEIELVESTDLASMFSVPNGRWEYLDLTVWNEEAHRHNVLNKMVPYTKWLGSHSTLARKSLSTRRCVYDVDLSTYSVVPLPEETSTTISIPISASGRAHALVGSWVAFESLEQRESLKLDSQSDYLGRSLTWPHYVQAVALPSTDLGVLRPIEVRAGQEVQVQLVVRNGNMKRTGAAGPELSFSVIPPPTDGLETSNKQDEL